MSQTWKKPGNAHIRERNKVAKKNTKNRKLKRDIKDTQKSTPKYIGSQIH